MQYTINARRASFQLNQTIKSHFLLLKWVNDRGRLLKWDVPSQNVARQLARLGLRVVTVRHCQSLVIAGVHFVNVIPCKASIQLTPQHTRSSHTDVSPSPPLLCVSVLRAFCKCRLSHPPGMFWTSIFSLCAAGASAGRNASFCSAWKGECSREGREKERDRKTDRKGEFQRKGRKSVCVRERKGDEENQGQLSC